MKDLNYIIIPFVVASFAGIFGTGLGGAFGFIIKKPSNKTLSFVYGISAGMMISIVCFDMLSEAFKYLSVTSTVIYILIGCVCILLFDEFLTTKTAKNNKLMPLTTGILMAITIATHNFPEGLAIGSTLNIDEKLGFGIAIVIMLHNIPEGVAIAVSLIGKKIKAVKIFILAILAGFPMGLGAIIGSLVTDMNTKVIGICLALASGAMFAICTSELIPSSTEAYKKNYSGFSVIMGFVIGIILSKLF